MSARRIRVGVAAATAALLVQGAAAATAPRADAAPVRVVITADGRTPVAGAPWHYAVRATTADGEPASGTVLLKVLLAGRVVDVLGVHRFSGARAAAYRWSPTLAGARAVLQATVVTDAAATRAVYAVNVVGRTGRPRFTATLSGEGHVARAGTPWSFVVRARKPGGHPVGGTVVAQVSVGGHIVDTVGWFGFPGWLRRSYRWPTQLRGKIALLQARVIGPGGSRTVGYLVRVR